MFDTGKVLKKEKNVNIKSFLIFDFIIKNYMKEN